MIKKTLLAAAFFVFFAPLFGQINWFAPDDNWYFHITSGWVGEGREKLWVGAGDTTVLGKKYQKIDRKALFLNGVEHFGQRLARQDGRKIFVFGYDGAEFLMYDFDLPVGSKVPIPIALGGQNDFGYEIVAVADETICGQIRRVQKVEFLNIGWGSAQKGTIVEGIGCTEGLHLIAGEWCATQAYLFLDEPDALAADGERRTFCSFESGGCAFEGLGATLCAALSSGENRVLEAKIFPNPSSDGQVFIQMLGGAAVEKVELFDALGRLIEAKKVSSEGLFSTDFRGAGFLKIWAEKGSAAQRVVFW